VRDIRVKRQLHTEVGEATEAVEVSHPKVEAEVKLAAEDQPEKIWKSDFEFIFSFFNYH
jgi:hypothetical protein